MTWYTILTHLGFALGCTYLVWFIKKFDNLKVFDFITRFSLLYILILWGGKIFSWFELRLFTDSTYSLLEIQTGRWYGSLFFLALYIFIRIISKQNQFNELKYLDYFAMAICLSLPFGKLGCFIDALTLGDHVGCYGKITDLPWGVRFRDDKTYLTFPSHPIQLYDAIYHSILFIALSISKIKNGLKGILFFTMTSVFNLFIENIRDNPHFFFEFTFGHCVYFSVIVIAILIYIKTKP